MTKPEHLIEQIGVKEEIPDILLPLVSYLNEKKQKFEFLKIENNDPFNGKEEYIIGLRLKKFELTDFLNNNQNQHFRMQEDFFLGFRSQKSKKLFIFKLQINLPIGSISYNFFLRNTRTGLDYKIGNNCIIEEDENLFLKEANSLLKNKEEDFGTIETVFVLTENLIKDTI